MTKIYPILAIPTLPLIQETQNIMIKSRHCIYLIFPFFILLSKACFFNGTKEPRNNTEVFVDNNTVWKDTDGNEILAQGGSIIHVDGQYNWIGPHICAPENKYGFRAFNRYTSPDLVNWTKQDPVLTPQTEGLPFSDKDWVGRPWVFHHEATDSFVMYCEWNDNKGPVRNNQIVVLVAPDIAGPWKCDTVYYQLPDAAGVRHTMGDLGGFQDDDGHAYILYTFDRGGPNKAQAIVRLDPENYRRIIPPSEGGVLAEFSDSEREAAAILKHESVYYYFTSDCLGWGPSATTYRTATHMDSTWSESKLLATEPHHPNSFQTQHDFILPVVGTEKTTYIYIGDRWSICNPHNYDGTTGLYAWFPLVFENSTPVLKASGYEENGGDWFLNPVTGEWRTGKQYADKEAGRRKTFASNPVRHLFNNQDQP